IASAMRSVPERTDIQIAQIPSPMPKPPRRSPSIIREINDPETPHVIADITTLEKYFMERPHGCGAKSPLQLLKYKYTIYNIRVK
ncbi:MAG: hypothetical protein Q8S35_02620, partial [bacterium]|nr:hypothetical protein [bacterium]